MSAEDIEVYDIEWLEKKIPDIRDFLARFQIVTNRGGYIAGGCLRRALERGGIESLFDPDRKWTLVENYLGLEVHRYPVGQIDVDFFFPDEEVQATSVNAWERKMRRYALKKKKEWLKKGKTGEDELFGYYSSPRFDDDIHAVETGYASTLYFIKDDTKFPIQFVKVRVGTPEDVLSTFDFVNCMIATDGDKVWVHKDLLKYEEEKILYISGEGLRTSMHKRVAKYVANGGYTGLGNKDALYNWWFTQISENDEFIKYATKWLYGEEDHGHANYVWQRVFFMCEGIVEEEEIPLFFSTDPLTLAIMMDKREEHGLRRYHTVQEY